MGPARGRVHRVAESQEQVATKDIVDSAPEQSRLEELLEESKPPYTVPVDGVHYLLKTPFRYPPLKHGSRFGQRFERSLFYGAASVDTALAETAYYRLFFVHHVVTDFPNRIRSQHLIFEVPVRAERCVKLQSEDWRDVRSKLVDPQDYRFTQALGAQIRSVGADAVQYISARAIQSGLRNLDDTFAIGPANALAGDTRGINWGLFYPSALHKKKPESQRPMMASTTKDMVSMTITEMDGSLTAREFAVESFMVDGQLPFPAA